MRVLGHVMLPLQIRSQLAAFYVSSIETSEDADFKKRVGNRFRALFSEGISQEPAPGWINFYGFS